jgi:5,10-methylenetetrahydromethanopterin reductase
MGSSWTDSPGVALTGADAGARAAAWARAAERAGLGSFWLIEDYYHPGAFALAGAAAAVTERIAIGIGVVNPSTRHPAILAMEAAALADMAPGRILLGLGSSNRNWIEEQMGLPFRTPLADLEEGAAIVRRLLGGERIDFDGRRFHMRGVQLESIPKRAVPILLGVKSARGLALAGRVADGVVCSVLASPAHVRRVRRTTGAERRDFAVAAYVAVAIDPDERRARDAVRPLLARYLGALHGQSILSDAGFGPERTQPFREALVRGERAESLIIDDAIDAFSLSGTAAQCRRQLPPWAAAGLDAPVAVLSPRADAMEQIALIGREIAPAWKELRCR